MQTQELPPGLQLLHHRVILKQMQCFNAPTKAHDCLTEGIMENGSVNSLCGVLVGTKYIIVLPRQGVM